MEKLMRTWVVSADMGYGHQRAIYPFGDIAEKELISIGKNPITPAKEQKQWENMLRFYETMSRAHDIPLIGGPIFSVLDNLLKIPKFYPLRDLSKSTLQVKMLQRYLKKGMCGGLIENIQKNPRPLLTSFYAPAIAADHAGLNDVFCIICDADVNRVWVPEYPYESRIRYFAPCSRAAQRLKAYGVAEDKIYITGFPIADELIGGKEMPILKKDLAQRLFNLDPGNRFWPLHRRSVEHFLGEENCQFKKVRNLTITYAVGGAGAQKEIALEILKSLRPLIAGNKIDVNLVAGTRKEVYNYFSEIKDRLFPGIKSVKIIYSENLWEYFSLFNSALRTTDILWTKPSELSFFCSLGIPVIMSPSIGSQEKFNRKWLREINAGIKQMNPRYTHEWLNDLLMNGRFAEAAWAGFLKARKLGTYKIKEVIEYGKMLPESSPIL